MNQPIGIARRINKPAARAVFDRGGTIAVSARGHETSFHVYPITTVHTKRSTTWEELTEQVTEWSNRYTNQRFYVINYSEGV